MSYSDLNQYDPSLKPVLKEIQAVYQSLNNLFGTDEGERLFRPEYGNILEETLFDLSSEDNSFGILSEIINRVERFEPRVLPDFQRSFVENLTDDNSYKLVLIFKIKNLGDNNTFQFVGTFSR